MTTGPFDLEAAITAADDARRERAGVAQAARDAEERRTQSLRDAERMRELDTLRRQVDATFPRELQEALRLTPTVDRWPCAILRYDDTGLTLTPTIHDEELRWSMEFEADLYSGWSQRGVPVADAPRALLELLGAVRRRHAEERRTEAERQAESTRLASVVASLEQAAASGLWVWPVGATITYHRLTYCIGGHVDDDGTTGATFADGYTATDRLDADGYITLEAWRECSWRWTSRPARRLRLIPEAHKPVFERLVARSIDDLPAALRESVTVEIRDIAREGVGEDAEDSDGIYVARPGYRWQRTVGEQPLPWLRDRAR